MILSYLRLPREERRELFPRLTSNDDGDLVPAFFELYLYQLFRRMGWKIEIHPQLAKSDKRPDFLLRDNDGNAVYVEAVTPTELSAKEVQTRRLIDGLLDGLDELEYKDWYLFVTLDSSDNQQPSVTRMRAELDSWLASLDAKSVKEKLIAEGHESLPTKELVDGKWAIQATAIPRNRPGTGRLIGSESHGVRYSQLPRTLSRAIRKKATRYGELDAPYLVAVNVLTSIGVDQDDVADALFGPQVVTISKTSPPVVEKVERKGGGALLGPAGPINTRVSGVLVIRDLTPWTVGQRDAEIYENPYAARSLGSAFSDITTWRNEGGELRKVDAQHARDILGLHDGWPELKKSGFSATVLKAVCAPLAWLNRYIPLP